MGVTFSLADDDARDRVKDIMGRYHEKLRDAGVVVGILFAATDKEGESSIKVNGVAKSATIKVVSLKDRVLKEVDAELVIAHEGWEEMDPETARGRQRRNALIDHELSHLRLKRGEYRTVLGPDGRPERGPDGEETGRRELDFDVDDLGRPKLSTVPGDVDAGDAFEQVIRRWGSDAVEYRVLSRAGRWAEKAYDGHLGVERPDEEADATLPFADPAEDAA